MNKQELFDKVVRHLVKQGRPSGHRTKYGSFICSYLSATGEQCAAGCLLPKDHDYTKHNNCAWGRLVDLEPTLEDIGSISFIIELQLAHDSMSSHTNWRRHWFSNMISLAQVSGNLSTNVIEELATSEWCAVQV